jgi:3D (Asp-Asp-Asp) domain-containing protein
MKNLAFMLLFCSILNAQKEIVTSTVYNAVPEQTNSDPGHTASMFKIDLSNPGKHRIVALSRDLLKKFPYGSKIKITGVGKYDGIWYVRDTMNIRYKKRIDLLVDNHIRLGKWYNVKIELL